MLVKGQLKSAQLENLASDPTLLSDGLVWLNTVAAIPRVVIGGATRDLVTVDATQDVSNKSLYSAKVGAGTGLNHVVRTNGSGVITTEAFLARALGGCGQDMSAVTIPSTGTLANQETNLPFTGEFSLDRSANSQTGTDVTITNPAKAIVRLTGVGLVSIAGIASQTKERLLIIVNKTASAVDVLNENVVATAANRILSGTGQNISLGVDSSLWLYYDTVSSRWHVVGGSGGGGSAVTSAQTITSGGTVALTGTATKQLIRVSGLTPVTTSTTPFSTTPPQDLCEITLVGTSNDNPVTIPFNDAIHGAVGNFEALTLGQYQTAKFVYSSALQRYVLC